jgi:hypothetical protein
MRMGVTFNILLTMNYNTRCFFALSFSFDQYYLLKKKAARFLFFNFLSENKRKRWGDIVKMTDGILNFFIVSLYKCQFASVTHINKGIYGSIHRHMLDFDIVQTSHQKMKGGMMSMRTLLS